jgi:hypothetical protein
MPAFRGKINEKQARELIAWVRRLGGKQNSPATNAEAPADQALMTTPHPHRHAGPFTARQRDLLAESSFRRPFPGSNERVLPSSPTERRGQLWPPALPD